MFGDNVINQYVKYRLHGIRHIILQTKSGGPQIALNAWRTKGAQYTLYTHRIWEMMGLGESPALLTSSESFVVESGVTVTTGNSAS